MQPLYKWKRHHCALSWSLYNKIDNYYMKINWKPLAHTSAVLSRPFIKWLHIRAPEERQKTSRWVLITNNVFYKFIQYFQLLWYPCDNNCFIGAVVVWKQWNQVNLLAVAPRWRTTASSFFVNCLLFLWKSEQNKNVPRQVVSCEYSTTVVYYPVRGGSNFWVTEAFEYYYGVTIQKKPLWQYFCMLPFVFK